MPFSWKTKKCPFSPQIGLLQYINQDESSTNPFQSEHQAGKLVQDNQSKSYAEKTKLAATSFKKRKS